MNNLEGLLESQNVTHVTNYSGEFQTGVDYKKFDFVYYTGDGRFYYAKEDAINGGGNFIEASQRLALVPDGPISSEGQTHYIVDLMNRPDAVNLELRVGQVLNLEGCTGDNSGIYRVLDIEKDIKSLNNDPDLEGTAIQVLPVSGGFNDFEPIGPQTISLSSINTYPSDNSNTWTADKFFFDADYNSTANFKANNYKYQYGNGYYIVQPKNINSLTFELDLEFKNRTNRESNAIVHFLENHQGQREEDMPSPNLKYSQGISGFKWDGNAAFFPYNSNEMQLKKFYCNEWSHALNFENSNDITVRLRNLDTSILNKSEGLFLNPPNEYSEAEYYEKNDVVYSNENKKFYYWSGESPEVGKFPVEAQDSWTRENGYFKDVNTEYWSRSFFWRPSLSLNVTQKPRMNEIMSEGGYSQMYRDGINESLLSLELEFSNRSEGEAYAILHFLEQHLGYIPFEFKPPAPYESSKNFICQEWQHKYTYKNNHSIKCVFEQFPLDFTASEYDNNISPSSTLRGELLCPNPLIIAEANIDEPVYLGNYAKKRVELRNIGGESVTVYNLKQLDEYSPLSIVSQSSDDDVCLINLNSLNSEDFIYRLDNDNSLPFNLSNQYVKVDKSYTEGLDGGQFFTIMDRDGDNYTLRSYNGLTDKYFQDNRGNIKSIARAQSGESVSSALHSEFLIKNFFIKNKANQIPGGQSAFFDIAFYGEINPLNYDFIYHMNNENAELGDLVFVTEGGEEVLISSLFGQGYYGGGISIGNSSLNSNILINASIYISDV